MCADVCCDRGALCRGRFRVHLFRLIFDDLVCAYDILQLSQDQPAAECILFYLTRDTFVAEVLKMSHQRAGIEVQALRLPHELAAPNSRVQGSGWLDLLLEREIDEWATSEPDDCTLPWSSTRLAGRQAINCCALMLLKPRALAPAVGSRVTVVGTLSRRLKASLTDCPARTQVMRH